MSNNRSILRENIFPLITPISEPFIFGLKRTFMEKIIKKALKKQHFNVEWFLLSYSQFVSKDVECLRSAANG